MDSRRRMTRSIRKVLGLLLMVAGLSTTWAWGEAARLAGPQQANGQTPVVALYAAWVPEGERAAGLFQSTDEGATWQLLSLPVEGTPLAWADNGNTRVAAVMADGLLLLSEDQGANWIVVETGLDILSLAWDKDENLYLGTNGAGVYQLKSSDALRVSRMMDGELASGRIVSLSVGEGRLFAATPSVVMYTDNTDPSLGDIVWTRSAPVPDLVTSVAAADKQVVYVGTATTGIYRSVDAGRTWAMAGEGLGLAAGQMVGVTALRADPLELGVLYAAVDYMVGSTRVHASAAGLFVTLDSGAWWQPLAGPQFPMARHASDIVLVPGKPLQVRAVTAEGLQAYAPDVMGILAALESNDPKVRASAARQLGIVRPQGVWNELLAALDDPELVVSLAAADALGRIDDPAAVPGLLIAIEHPSQQVRLSAARALGMMRVEAAIEPLQAMFLLGEGLETSVAGEALSRVGGPAAIDVLLTAIADPQPTARWHAAMAALEKIGEPAVLPLAGVLDGQDAYARRNAAQALGWIGSPSATETLMATLKRDGDATVRAQAAWALGEIGDPAARKVLDRAQRQDPALEVQAAAEWALSYLPMQSEVYAGWANRWARLLNQLQPLRWLVLALSLAGAAWLMLDSKAMVAAPQRLRYR